MFRLYCLFVYFYVSLVQDSLLEIVVAVSCHITNKRFCTVKYLKFSNSLGRSAQGIAWMSFQLGLLNSVFYEEIEKFVLK